MQTIYAQWTDSSETSILAVFSCTQDADVYPNQATLTSDDARYATWYKALPETIKQAGGLVPPGT